MFKLIMSAVILGFAATSLHAQNLDETTKVSDSWSYSFADLTGTGVKAGIVTARGNAGSLILTCLNNEILEMAYVTGQKLPSTEQLPEGMTMFALLVSGEAAAFKATGTYTNDEGVFLYRTLTKTGDDQKGTFFGSIEKDVFVRQLKAGQQLIVAALNAELDFEPVNAVSLTGSTKALTAGSC